MTDRETERERNRREFPEAAAFIDRLRGVFGAGVRLLWWVENGKSIGNVPAEIAEGLGDNRGENTKHKAGFPTIAEHGAGRP